MEKKKTLKFNWLRRLFCPRKDLDIFQEEQMQSPFRTVVRKFVHNKLAMAGLIIFLLIFLFVLIGPLFFPLNLGDSDETQVNVSPGRNMMAVPSAMKKDIGMISPSTQFGIGLSGEGKIYTWGKTKLTPTKNLKNIPAELKNATVVKVAAGTDHAVALTSTGKLVAWGTYTNGQTDIPMNLLNLKAEDVKQLVAGNQFSAVLTTDGVLTLWGNTYKSDLKVKEEYQGHISKVALTTFGYIVLLDDGNVAFTGSKPMAFEKVPESVATGGNVVDIAAGDASVAALCKDGSIVVWGNTAYGENVLPAFDSKVVKIGAGKFHYTAVTESGKVYSWGYNKYGQATVPEKLDGQKVKDIYVGSFQNYAVTESGKLVTWGLSGYILGTDALGRDIMSRLVNGGRMTMTVGAVAVIISVIIGVVLGCVGGYFGGRVDMLVCRIAEIVGGLPFLPFALILSAVIGQLMTNVQKTYMIMVILGVLSWTGIFRLVRAQVFSARESEYVTAAKAMGVPERKIIFRHILPNVISIVVVSATLDFASAMLTESSLSYLGFGITPPTPTWGNMLKGANNSVVIEQYWWQWVFTSLIFAICTICINTVGDGLRDAIDPKSNSR